MGIDMSSILITLALGLVTGLLVGMFGIGGGIVFVPTMVILLGADQHLAQGVSLTAVALVATAGAITHYHQGVVKLNWALWMIPSAVIFALLGGWLAGYIDQLLLGRIFGVLLLFVGMRMVLGK